MPHKDPKVRRVTRAKWLDDNREKQRLYQRDWAREWRKQNPEISKKRSRDSEKKRRLKDPLGYRSKRLGVIVDRYPSNNCEACGKPFDPVKRRPCADHCHITKNFRGWLCFNCNSSLGHANDSREGLQLLMNYLDNTEIWR